MTRETLSERVRVMHAAICRSVFNDHEYERLRADLDAMEATLAGALAELEDIDRVLGLDGSGGRAARVEALRGITKL